METGQDIVEELGPLLHSVLVNIHATTEADSADDSPAQTGRETDLALSEAQQTILAIIGFEPTTIDRVIQQTRLTADTVSSILVTLELQGFITSQGGNYSRLAR